MKPDRFSLALVATVVLASLLPVRSEAAVWAGRITAAAIALLFFLHGAKLSREAVLQGLGAWRLHLLVLAATFVLFPLIGATARLLPGLKPEVAAGVLYMTLLPSTVQSSIAFTSLARGNVPAAVCAASASNLLGVFLTPALVALLMPGWVTGGGGGVSAAGVGTILLQLLAPFVLGHLSRPLTAAWVERHKRVVGLVDRGSILLVVYTAFSAAVVEGLWRRLGAVDLAVVAALDAAILAAVLLATRATARALQLPKPDEIALVFCGSKKSLASGAPMAAALFPAASAGVLLTPVMIFHQLQLLACAAIAQRYAARIGPPGTAPEPRRSLP